MNIKYAFLLASFFALPIHAKLSQEQGFSGEISLITGFSSTTSNLDTDSDRQLSSINQSADSESNFIAIPLGSLAYTFGDTLNQQFYLGTTRDDIATGAAILQVGYKYQLPSETIIDISFLPTILSGETWENPYLENAPRKKTDESGNAFRLKLQNIMGSKFALDMAYASKEVDDDTVVFEELKRDADSYYVKGQYRFTMSRSLLISPSLIYQSTSADGDAAAYDKIGGEVSIFGVMDRHQFAFTAGYSRNGYDETHPIYDKTRSDDEYSLFAAYEYNHFMNWNNWAFVSLAGYSTKHSNITFYDESEYLVSLGLNYKF